MFDLVLHEQVIKLNQYVYFLRLDNFLLRWAKSNGPAGFALTQYRLYGSNNSDAGFCRQVYLGDCDEINEPAKHTPEYYETDGHVIHI